MICPCCKKQEVEDWECCPECGWTNNWYQTENPDSVAENTISLNFARKLYAKYGTIEVDMSEDEFQG